MVGHLERMDEYGMARRVLIIIIILESAVQGQERVRSLYQSKDPNPTQPTPGRKKKIKQQETKKNEQIMPNHDES